MSPRVLHVVPTLLLGGAEHVASFYAVAFHEPRVPAILAGSGGPWASVLRARGVDFRLASRIGDAAHRSTIGLALAGAARSGRERLRETLRRPGDEGVTKGVWPLLRPGSPMARSLERVVRRFHPGCIHAHTAFLADAGRIGHESGAKVVLQMHNMLGERHGDDGRRLILAGLETCDHVVCVSLAQAEDFRRVTDWPVDRLSVIHNPSFHASGARAPRREHPRVLGCLGNLGAAKGIGRLLDAFTALIAQMPDARLEVVGGTPRTRRKWKLESARRGLKPPSIEFVGTLHQSDRIDRWFSGIDLLVSTSLTEAFPLQVTEALSRGIPVVASDIPAHREILLGGTAGALASADEPRAFASVIAETLRDPRRMRELSDAGFRHWNRSLSNDRAVSLLRSLYGRLCSE